MTAPPPHDPQSAPARVAAGLAKLALVIRHEAWRASGARGLTPTQQQILATLRARGGPLRLARVADELAITPATASEAVAALVDKRLVAKRRSPDDGRAVDLTLTARGRREADRAAAAWPPALLDAVAELPEAERAGLVRGLVGTIHALHRRGAIPTARLCVGCRFFRPNEHPAAPDGKRHRCDYIDAPIGDADLRTDCPEMQPAGPDTAPRLWALLVEGRSLTADPAPPGG